MHDYQFLASTTLFEGSTPEEIGSMLNCLGMHTKAYEQGERIFHMGDTLSEIGLILEGQVRIESVDVWGNISVIGSRGRGMLFGEAYAAVPNEPLMVDVVAAQDCLIMFLNVPKVLTTCSHACPNHSRTSTNLTRIIARQNLSLSQRIFFVTPKTIRGKVLAYLSDQAERANSNEFDIPFDRQQLANYLGVDRSALSAELSRMAKDGILATRRNHFILKDV